MGGTQPSIPYKSLLNFTSSMPI